MSAHPWSHFLMVSSCIFWQGILAPPSALPHTMAIHQCISMCVSVGANISHTCTQHYRVLSKVNCQSSITVYHDVVTVAWCICYLNFRSLSENLNLLVCESCHRYWQYYQPHNDGLQWFRKKHWARHPDLSMWGSDHSYWAMDTLMYSYVTSSVISSCWYAPFSGKNEGCKASVPWLQLKHESILIHCPKNCHGWA